MPAGVRHGKPPQVHLPHSHLPPLAVLGRRLLVAVALILFVAVVAWVGRDGYVDQTAEDGVSFLDALYYATVSTTTTGYGDVVPVSDAARLSTTLLVTPARILFLILLVGTTVELLAERSRQAIMERFWRRRLNNHVIVCGFGTKGHTAVEVLLGKGIDRRQIVVIDPRTDAVERAEEQGLAAVHGDASTSDALRAAEVQGARAVVVAPDRDDTAVLITLTARELNRAANISAAVREAENVHLLHESGATSVITSSASAGRLLGLAAETPRSVEVLEDLLSIGEGLDLVERDVGPDQAGPRGNFVGDDLLVGVVRGDEILRFDDPATAELQAGDRLICLRSHRDAA
jgi:voltage-gated potassium channel